MKKPKKNDYENINHHSLLWYARKGGALLRKINGCDLHK